ncbi:MAG: hypothetical protein KA263_07030, partial [Aeromonas sp.]|nr:hypothetical protein [Aeromonas sp.]
VQDDGILSQLLFDLFNSFHKCLTRAISAAILLQTGQTTNWQTVPNARSDESIRRSLIRIMARIKSCSLIFDAATIDGLWAVQAPSFQEQFFST